MERQRNRSVTATCPGNIHSTAHKASRPDLSTMICVYFAAVTLERMYHSVLESAHSYGGNDVCMCSSAIALYVPSLELWCMHPFFLINVFSVRCACPSVRLSNVSDFGAAELPEGGLGFQVVRIRMIINAPTSFVCIRHFEWKSSNGHATPVDNAGF